MTLREQFKNKITFKCSICGKEVTQSYHSYYNSNGICKGCMLRKSGRVYDSAKMKAAFEKKYGKGITNPSQIKSVVEKRKETFKERFGTDNPAKNNAVKEKIKNTNIERYGTSCTLHTPEIAEKVKQTMIDRYDTECSLSSPAVRKKGQQTMIKKYGMPFPSQNAEILKKQQIAKRNTMHQDFKNRCIKLLKARNIIFTETSDLLYECECPKCHFKWIWTPYKWVNEVHYHPILYCEKCYHSGHSIYEDAIIKMIPENIKYISNDRNVLKPKELDLYFPDNSLAVEFDGDFWHNDSDKTLQKMKACEDKGIRLINIFEHEFDESKIRSILWSALNVSPQIKYYARRCDLREIENNEYDNFCEENHIQGKASAKIRLGLFYNDELVQVMSFNKPRFAKNYEWEMIRECTKNCCAVVGGKEKLFKYFLKAYSPKSIVSYCDRRYFTGDSYLKLGFKLDHISKPSYFYVKNEEVLTRYQCQKHKLKALISSFDPNMSESDNMIANGYFKLYDFGQKVFTYATN